jgi:hypothetical protein
VYVLPPLPRCSGWALSSLFSPSRNSLPRKRRRVGLHIVLFEACSAFTRVAARTLAQSPICDQLHRRLQPFRHLHDCSGCFRLERSPGGARTHWKAPPSHGAHVERSFGVATADGAIGGSLTSLKEKQLKIGTKVVSHGRYVALQMAGRGAKSGSLNCGRHLSQHQSDARLVDMSSSKN